MSMECVETAANTSLHSRYVEVLGSRIHYMEAGIGDPIVFIHGMPTSSYLWRNVMPHVADLGRCIAIDLIGMGKSDKPNIKYSVFDHCAYFKAFVTALALKNVTLVLHGWGSVIGFTYAMRYPANVRALAFLEAHIRPVTRWDMLSLPMQELASLQKLPDGGYSQIMQHNYFVNTLLSKGVVRELTAQELAYYQAPFVSPGSCKPLWQYFQEVPLGETYSPVIGLIARYSQQLTQSLLPKLMLYVMPGFTTTIDTLSWARDNLPQLRLAYVGDDLHYAQESNPMWIGNEIANWYAELGAM